MYYIFMNMNISNILYPIWRNTYKGSPPNAGAVRRRAGGRAWGGVGWGGITHGCISILDIGYRICIYIYICEYIYIFT